jgi:polygalacturonase
MAKKFTTFKMHLLRWLTAICLASSALAENHFDIADFGAKGDGHTLSTGAISAAVKACHDAGGGQVVVPPGIFVTGTIRLLDRVQLHLVSVQTHTGNLRQ